MSGALFPNEIDSTLLRLSEPQVHNDRGDWSADLTYDDLPLQIQTPWLKNVFGVSQYTNSNDRVSYSLSFELREREPEIAAFREFLDKLDNWFKEQFKKEDIKGEYFSSIRPSKKPQYPDTLRTKLKVRRGAFECDLMENNIRVQFGTDNAKDKIKHGDRCRMVLQLMPVWSAGGKVGISWKVTSIQKQVNANFRFNNSTDIQIRPPQLIRRDTYKPDMDTPSMAPIFDTITKIPIGPICDTSSS